MLPLIVIGADEVVAQSFAAPNLGRALESPLEFFSNAETAMGVLNARWASYLSIAPQFRSERAVRDMIEWEEENGWKANVFYGPRALGEATIGKPQRLAHTGWTAILTHNLQDSDPAKPRRMMAGVPEGEDQSSIVWQAAPMLRAHFVVDVTARDSEGKPRGLLDVLDLLEKQPQP